MFNIKDIVKLDKIAYQLVYSYRLIQEEFTDFELRRGIVNWRAEIFDCLILLNIEEITYILNILKQEEYRVYLEVYSLYYEYEKQNKNTKKSKFSIGNIIKEIKHEDICINS